MAELEGRVALVTGAGSGIGRAIALQYAREGARVVVSDVGEAAGRETVRLIEEAGGEARFVTADVSSEEQCEALVRATEEAYGALHVACNNAGIGGDTAPTGEHPAEGWRRVIDVNLSGVFYCMRHQIPAMLRAGGGSIVNLGSILSQVGFVGSPAYAAAKHAMLGLTRTAALEYGAQGIRVNCVAPAFIRTPMIAALESDEESYQFLVDRHPIGRLGESDEVAEVVGFISSDRASFVTGAYIPVDGGYLAQ